MPPLTLRWPWRRKPPQPDAQIGELRTQVDKLTSELETTRSLISQSPMPGAPDSYVPMASRYPIYAYDQPYRYAVPINPQRRPGSIVTVDTLRQLADTYDVLRACIQHLKREVSQVPINVVPRDSQDKSEATLAQCKEVEHFFEAEGGLGGRGLRREHFENMMIEDVCVVGAAAVFFAPTLSGRISEVISVDAATIRPKVDAYGWPGPGEAKWEQWVYGVKIAEFTDEQLHYDGVYPVSYSPYFKSPIEYIINPIHSALRADEWNREWLTHGNTPSDVMALPEQWTPTEIREWAEYWDMLLQGDSRERQKTKFVPGGTQRVGPASRKDQDFQEYELWLLRRTCSVMGVAPASIGYAGEQYKVTQEGSMKATTEFGVGVLLTFRKALYDELLRRLGYPELQIQNVTAQEEEAGARAQRNNTLVQAGIKTINEARAEEGLDPIEGGDVTLVQSFVTPLSNVLNPPQPGGPGGAPAPAAGGAAPTDAGGGEAQLGVPALAGGQDAGGAAPLPLAPDAGAQPGAAPAQPGSPVAVAQQVAPPPPKPEDKLNQQASMPPWLQNNEGTPTNTPVGRQSGEQIEVAGDDETALDRAWAAVGREYGYQGVKGAKRLARAASAVDPSTGQKVEFIHKDGKVIPIKSGDAAGGKASAGDPYSLPHIGHPDMPDFGQQRPTTMPIDLFGSGLLPYGGAGRDSFSEGFWTYGSEGDITLDVDPAAPDAAQATARYRGACNDLFGKPVEPAELGQLLGMPRHSQMQVSGAPSMIDVRIDNPLFSGSCTRKVFWGPLYRSEAADQDGPSEGLQVYNDRLAVKDRELHPNLPPGIGFRILLNEVMGAQRMGAEQISMLAAGEPGSKANGYYTWTRLGCNGPLKGDTYDVWRSLRSPEVQQKWPGLDKVAEYLHQQGEFGDLNDLMIAGATVDKRFNDFWKEHGGAGHRYLDLPQGGREKSKGIRVLEYYAGEMAQKGIRPLGTPPQAQPGAGVEKPEGDPRRVVLSQWEKKAINRVKRGQSPECRFETDDLPTPMWVEIHASLRNASSIKGVRGVFRQARERLDRAAAPEPIPTFAEAMAARLRWKETPRA